jgi:hypothetical protein
MAHPVGLLSFLIPLSDIFDASLCFQAHPVTEEHKMQRRK